MLYFIGKRENEKGIKYYGAKLSDGGFDKLSHR